jgi:peptidoglycan/LPS O-acetylase OafA/YrhL
MFMRIFSKSSIARSRRKVTSIFKSPWARARVAHPRVAASDSRLSEIERESSPPSPAQSTQAKMSRGNNTPPHDGITLLRAVVCLSIVGMHFYPPMLDTWPTKQGFLPSPRWFVTNTRLGFESFFVLAGYFLAHCFRPGPWSSFSVLAFFRRRLFRLAVPYWVALLFVGVVGDTLGVMIGHHSSFVQFSDLWPQVFFVQDIMSKHIIGGSLWFMAPLMQFYLIWGLIFWVIRRFFLHINSDVYHKDAIQIMVWIMMAVFIGSALFAGRGMPTYWALANNAHYLILGCLIYWYCADLVNPWWTIGAIIAEVVVGYSLGSSRPFAAVVTSIFLVLSAGYIFTAGPSLTWLTYVGRCTYSIYLTHDFIGPRVMYCLRKFFGNEDVSSFNAIMVWLAGICSSVLFGVVFYFLVERPCKRIAGNISYRR